VIITLDFLFHWLIPFTLLAVKRPEAQQEAAGAGLPSDDLRQGFDLFWLIEPNFKDAARNLHFSWGILNT